MGVLCESRSARQVHNAIPTRTTPFQRKKDLPWVGLEPTTLRFLLSYQGSSGRALSVCEMGIRESEGVRVCIV